MGVPTFKPRATFERLTGTKGLREPEATLEPRVHECVRHTSELYRCHVTYIGVTLSPLGWVPTFEPRATFERLTGPKCLREPEATLEPRVHECVRHLSHSQARRALGSRRPHSNRVSTSACDTRLNCIWPKCICLCIVFVFCICMSDTP